MPTAAIAIFTDNSPRFHPKEFRSEIFSTTVQYNFQTYKLRDNKVSDFRKSTNPFSIILETAWWELKKNKLTDQELLKRKITLYKRMRKLGFGQKQVIDLLDFIKFYTNFEQPELFKAFDNEISKISKDIEDMSIQEAIIQGFKEEAKIEGKIESLQETLAVIKMLKNGETAGSIAKKLNIKLETVEIIQKTLLEK